MLENKKILLGICGGIAAYKSLFLIRLLKKAGADVKVIFTPSTHNFITPLTASTLSKNPVLTEFYKEEGTWNNHVDLALWADLMVIAPASANTMAKMVSGVCDNLLLATYLSAKCPVMIAPAMDLDMFEHPTTHRNLTTLKSDKVEIIDAEVGELASGLEGKGRMAEPEHIFKHIEGFFLTNNDFSGKSVLLTAGPTYEQIDPVRFVGNRSSGKMGLALCEELLRRGAEVNLVLGPVTIQVNNHPKLNIRHVESAIEMMEACNKVPGYDIGIFTAAVSDYRPQNISDQKIKKEDTHSFQVAFEENPDIAKSMGESKNGKFHVGFALETHNEHVNAQRKLKSKNFDLIVLNSLNDTSTGFGYDTNKITIFDKDNNSIEFELKSKDEVAKDIVNVISEKIHHKS